MKPYFVSERQRGQYRGKTKAISSTILAYLLLNTKLFYVPVETSSSNEGSSHAQLKQLSTEIYVRAKTPISFSASLKDEGIVHAISNNGVTCVRQ